MQVEAATEPVSRPRRKLFHGWILVFAGLVAGAFTTGAGTWAVSLFVQPMTQELGWSRSAFFGALTVRSIVSGVIAPVIGPMQDSHNGPRRLMFITAIGMSAGLISLYWVEDLIVFYLLFGVVGEPVFAVQRRRCWCRNTEVVHSQAGDGDDDRFRPPGREQGR